jgi:uncharacterized protein YhfF
MRLPPDLDGYWQQYAAETADYWTRVCEKKGIDPSIEPDVHAWTPVPIFSDLMLNLILHGSKRATAHPMLQYEVENRAPHAVGDYSVILDGFARPGCVIQTTRVEIKPFGEADEAFATAESEGGGLLPYWRLGHWAFLEDYCKVHGTEMSDELPTVFEHFELIDPS